MFWHNPFAEMYGPHFLALYLFVIGIVVGICIWLRNNQDRSSGLPALSVPPNPDPYEIAYLRGGANEVVRTAIYKLLKLGYLVLEPLPTRTKRSNAQQIARSEQAPDPAHLSPIDAELMTYFERPSTTAALFKSSLPYRVDSICQAYLSSLVRDKLIAPPDWRESVRPIRLLASAFILIFGGYKLVAALHNGHYNIGFLIVLAILGLIFVALATRVPRISNRGRRYLNALRHAYGSPVPLRYNQLVESDSAIPISVLAMSVVGIGVLSGTPDALYGRIFAKAQAAGGSCGGGSGGCGTGTCASTTGGSGGGGGGCGGGGGGGGGCGGCGGGGS